MKNGCEKKQKRPPENSGGRWIQPIGAGARGVTEMSVSDARRFLLTKLLRAVAQLVGFLQERVLLRLVFLEQRLRAEEEVLVDQRFHVVRLQLERVVDRLEA